MWPDPDLTKISRSRAITLPVTFQVIYVLLYYFLWKHTYRIIPNELHVSIWFSKARYPGLAGYPGFNGYPTMSDIRKKFSSLMKIYWFYSLFELLQFQGLYRLYLLQYWKTLCTVCPRSLDQFYTITYYLKLVKTSWTYSNGRKYIRSIPRSRPLFEGEVKN